MVRAAAFSDPPNILLIMADDLGWSDLGCYGSEIPTPNLDRLAREGMLFTHFYNNAKCTTTRASLMTGLYPRRGGRGIELLNDRMRTVAEVLREQGYQTGMSGKWHNGSRSPHRPIDRGFDESYGLWDGCCNFFDPAQQDPSFKGAAYRFFGQNDRRISEFPNDFYTTDAFTDHAIETIQNHLKTGKPFFHYLAYTAPHYPLHAPEEDIRRFEGQYSDGWERYREQRHQRQIELGLWDDRWQLPTANTNTRSSSQLPHPQWQQRRMETYAAMLWRMDLQIGRLLDVLDQQGVADHTLVVFSFGQRRLCGNTRRK